MPGGDPGKWKPHPVLIFRADSGVPAQSKGTKSGQFDWSDTLLSRHYRRLLSYSFDFVNFENQMLHKIKDIKICVSFCAQYMWKP